MPSPATRRTLSVALIVALSLSLSVAQQSQDPKDIETIKIDTDLVTVPVVATDANGTYVADLKQEDFVISEDGVPHKIAFFGKVSMPFHVVLMIDTS